VFRIFFLRLSFGIAVRPIHSSHPQEMKSNFVKKKKIRMKIQQQQNLQIQRGKIPNIFIAKINSLLKTRL
jgi:hypothetical protein